MLKKTAAALLAVALLAASVFAPAAYAEELPDDTADLGEEAWAELLDYPSEVMNAVPPEVSAPSAILIEVSTGKILYEKDADSRRAPASVTKIMTMLLVMEALENGKITLEDRVPCSDNAASMGGSQIWLDQKEQLTVRELLKAVAVASANDASVALGEFIAGSEQGFIAMMNERAAGLGMTNTTFVNCTGLDADGHLTTARDIALMSRELLMKYPGITEYTTIWMDTLRDGAFGLSNTNKLVRYYSGITGLKTGSTGDALYCISASAKRNDMELIAVIMAGPTSKDRFADAARLLDYGFANWGIARRRADELPPMAVAVRKGKTDTVAAVPPGDFQVLTESGRKAALEYNVTLTEDVTAPVEKGQKIGEIVFTLDGETVGTMPLCAEERVEALGFFGILAKLFRYIFMMN